MRTVADNTPLSSVPAQLTLTGDFVHGSIKLGSAARGEPPSVWFHASGDLRHAVQ